MRKIAITSVSVLALAACGSEPAPGPTEQIVVREPGDQMTVTVAATEETASEKAGQAAFAVCAVCHAVEAGAASSIGPNLHGVVGRAAGAAQDFAYSEALKSSGISWSESELDAYITDPTGRIPGTTMATGAVSDGNRRKAIITYLKNSTN